MSEVTLVDRLGNINFGAPDDIAPHKKPWAFYDVLGISRDADTTQIKQAARDLSAKNHPDKYASQGSEAQAEAGQRQQLILTIRDVLLDKGGELGEEWSRRKLYDQVSQYGEFFGDTHITKGDNRTDTAAEDLFHLLEVRKKKTEHTHEFEKKNPEAFDAMQKAKEAAERGSHHTARQHQQRVMEILAESEGISTEELQAKIEQSVQRHERKIRDHVQDSHREFESSIDGVIHHKYMNPMASSPRVFEIWYTGEKGSIDVVHFGGDKISGKLTGYKDKGNVGVMSIQGAGTYPGLQQIHFKAEHANVKITDAHLEGVVQVVHGTVRVQYDESSYGGIIRVRAPTVKSSVLDDFSGFNLDGFEQQGDLYIPSAFAYSGWEKQAPTLDIAVFDGTVSLELRSPQIQRRNQRMDRNSLENKIIKPFYSDDYSINKLKENY
jgi:curved DNA-binding protein CbpA